MGTVPTKKFKISEIFYKKHTSQLFNRLYAIVRPRCRIGKHSTVEEIEHFNAIDYEAVRLTAQYLAEGGSLNGVKHFNISLLKFAATYGCFPLAQLLVSEGADVNYNGDMLCDEAGGPSLDTPLTITVNSVNANADLAWLLLQNGADLDVTHDGMNLEEIMADGTMSWIPNEEIRETFQTILAMIRAEPDRRSMIQRHAFSMVLHDRVGKYSWVQDLDVGVVQMIMNYV